ncbi:MAG: hypothetical protein FE78DRAFT_70645 [Acidomyces sp. 'richmondensis']|nr:MAG: hypothetical protein FE78DRAFT_70645 [Acidomyces sp. 'richmondensis']
MARCEDGPQRRRNASPQTRIDGACAARSNAAISTAVGVVGAGAEYRSASVYCTSRGAGMLGLRIPRAMRDQGTSYRPTLNQTTLPLVSERCNKRASVESSGLPGARFRLRASLDPPPERWGSVRGATFKPTGSPLLLSVARSATLSPTASSTSRRRVNALGVVDVIIPPPLHVQTLLPPPAASEGAASTRRSPGARSVFERNIAPPLGLPLARARHPSDAVPSAAAIMASPRSPPPSIRLPPPADFHFRDIKLPKTPEQQERVLNNPPPPPRPHAFKVKRKQRAALVDFTSPEPLMSDSVIPTIEMSEAASEMSSPMFQSSPSAHEHGLLAPLSTFGRLVTPPKTPAPRFQASFGLPLGSPSNEWAMINKARDKQLRPAFHRSGSVCSSFSDSSISSCGSSDFSAPNIGGCTSPKSDATDPFADEDVKAEDHDKILFSPDQSCSPKLKKRKKAHNYLKWTQPMDEHLWRTYLSYLADPRVTPFKMLPGTVPPLGVCTRVASKARRTWGSQRPTTPSADAALSSDHMQRDGSPDTIRPEHHAKQPQWPRSDSATRRRLRSLCKRNVSLPSYYHRLLTTRTPSPFTSSSSAGHSSDLPTDVAFSSRDMNVSLAAATAPSMQPQGPLAQLASDKSSPPRPQSNERASRSADWFARIPRSQAHQKSLSLQSGLSINTPVNHPIASLASPFDDASSRSHLLQSMSTTKSLGRTANKEGKLPSLDSPVQLSGAPTAPRSLKRRFKSDEEKPKRPGLEDVFGPQADEVGIFRNRGFTVGAVRATDSLAKLFQPPGLSDQEMTEAPATFDQVPAGARSVPRRLAEPVPRLRSPFTEAPQYNTFPRSHVATVTHPPLFQQRLLELSAKGAVNRSH